MNGDRGWIGVDLDGTLALWDPDYFPRIGPPIPKMVNRVKGWLDLGKDVRIFTARVGPATQAEVDLVPDLPHPMSIEGWEMHQRSMIGCWCLEHIGKALRITATKDFNMLELWDDRCVQLVPNSGMTLGEHLRMDQRAKG